MIILTLNPVFSIQKCCIINIHVCACMRTCVCARVCVCQQLRQVRETFWSIQMCTLVFVWVVVEFSARGHPFRIC